MTNTTVPLGEHYLLTVMDIGKKITNESSKVTPTCAQPEEIKVQLKSSGLMTLRCLTKILSMVSEISKTAYIALVKQSRTNRRKSLNNPDSYHSALEGLERDIMLSVGATTLEVFERVGVTSADIDNSISYHLQNQKRQNKLLGSLMEARLKHRMEQGEGQGISGHKLEEIFSYLRNFTSDLKNFEGFKSYEKPGWNMSAMYETYMFDKVWEKFGIEEEDILRAICRTDIEISANLLCLVQEYRSNLIQLTAHHTTPLAQSSDFMKEKAKLLDSVQED